MPFESSSSSPDYKASTSRRVQERQYLDRESDKFWSLLNQPFGESEDYGTPAFESEAKKHWEQCQKACIEFLRPYQTGERLLSSLLENSETAVKMIEMMRQIYYVYKRDIDPREWPEREQGMDNVANFLSWEIASSLDLLDRALARTDLSRVDKQDLTNNIFYIVSEALDTHDEINRRELSSWLAKHKEEIFKLREPDPSVYDDEEDGVLGDDTPFITKKNIIERSEDESLAIAVVHDVITNGAASDLYDEERFYCASSVLIKVRPDDMQLARRKEMVAIELVKCFGLDEAIVKKWKEAKMLSPKKYGETKVYNESYSINFWALYELEREQPGAGRELFDKFGIANFDRYDTQLLLHQLKVSDRNVPYGITVYPEEDGNGAFFQNQRPLTSVSTQLQAGGYEMRIVEAGSQRELARRLLQLHKKYAAAGNKFAFAIVGGHGSTNNLTLGRNNASDQSPESDSFSHDPKHQQEWDMWYLIHEARKGEFSSKDLELGKGIGRAFQEWFEVGAPKVLLSCSTGADGGIAEKVSTKSTGEVTAPKIPTSLKNIDVSFDTNGKPVFSVEYSEGVAARYTAGEAQ